MSWTKPEYTRGRVDAAGRMLTEPSADSVERAEALKIINYWRSAHSYPLQVLKMTLLNRARKIDYNALIAQRLKRRPSIEAKLQRNPNMKLSRMQDIGGCRAVLASVDQIDHLANVYKESIAKSPHDRPECVGTDDYIANPKPDGYRSIHYVYRYRSKSPERERYNNLRIEVQIRSRLQHAWATAVETVSTFTNQKLKSNEGNDSWKRFFALMGTAIAQREGREIVPYTPRNKSELVDELRELYEQLQIETLLYAWRSAVDLISPVATSDLVNPDSYHFLLLLDAETRRLQIREFTKPKLSVAQEEYSQMESVIADNPHIQAVLVSVDSLDALRRAYPNYYADTSAFLEVVRLAIKEA